MLPAELGGMVCEKCQTKLSKVIVPDKVRPSKIIFPREYHLRVPSVFDSGRWSHDTACFPFWHKRETGLDEHAEGLKSLLALIHSFFSSKLIPEGRAK